MGPSTVLGMVEVCAGEARSVAVVAEECVVGQEDDGEDL